MQIVSRLITVIPHSFSIKVPGLGSKSLAMGTWIREYPNKRRPSPKSNSKEQVQPLCTQRHVLCCSKSLLLRQLCSLYKLTSLAPFRRRNRVDMMSAQTGICKDLKVSMNSEEQMLSTNIGCVWPKPKGNDLMLVFVFDLCFNIHDCACSLSEWLPGITRLSI